MTSENNVPVSQDSNVSLADVRRALEDPNIRKSAPNELIGNLINAMGLEDIPCIDTEEAERIRKIYFQATRLEKDRWTTMPGIENTVQIIPYKIKGDLPEGTHLVVDVLIDKSDYEAECFEKYVKNMMVRGNNIIFFAVGLFYLAMLYGYLHFPMQGNIWHMIFAMFLLVVSTQSFAVIIMSIAPSLRIGLSAAGLVGVLSLSIAGFSFPVPAMYLPFQAMSYVLPVRHYFLIYVDQALNGIPLYYSRWHYVALILFAVASTSLLPRLKKALMRQVYVP